MKIDFFTSDQNITFMMYTFTKDRVSFIIALEEE